MNQNEDELIALRWLKKQGWGEVRRICSDPPDFVVGKDEIAVEVTRLSRGPETDQKGLTRAINQTLAEFDQKYPAYTGSKWILMCEYPLFKKKPPKTRILKKQLRSILQYAIDQDSTEEDIPLPETVRPIPDNLGIPEWILECGMSIMFVPRKPNEDAPIFFLNSVEAMEGQRLNACIDRILRCMEDKNPNNRHPNREDGWWRQYGEYRLLLVDHLFTGMLSEDEMTEVRSRIEERMKSMGSISMVIVLFRYRDQAENIGEIGCTIFVLPP